MRVEIELTDAQRQLILEQLGGIPSPSARESLEMLVEATQRRLAETEAEVDRLAKTSERDAEFNDPRTVTADNPQGSFSPMSTANHAGAIRRAQTDRDGAYIRHQWAIRQLAEFPG